jgi:20S proteasome alpha/beta subunit
LVRPQRTIEQKVKKVEVIADQVILAGTGAVGLGQRFKEIVTDYWTSNQGQAKTPITIAKELCTAALRDFASTGMAPGGYGALLAFASGGKIHLCEFPTTDFQPEFKTQNMWFVSMGSGQQITDPFLGLMRRVFWGDTPPHVNEGIFAVTWALQHVIELNCGGIAAPAQLAVLDSEKRKARLLGDEEIQEHISNAQGAEKHLQSYRDILQGKKGEPIPPPPESSPKI